MDRDTELILLALNSYARLRSGHPVADEAAALAAKILAACGGEDLKFNDSRKKEPTSG